MTDEEEEQPRVIDVSLPDSVHLPVTQHFIDQINARSPVGSDPAALPLSIAMSAIESLASLELRVQRIVEAMEIQIDDYPPDWSGDLNP